MTFSQRLRELLQQPQRILITTHLRPDGDAMGSSLGLYNYLKEKGHFVQVVTPTDFPRSYAWMKGSDHVLDAQTSLQQASLAAEEAQLIFCLDYGVLKRLATFEAAVRTSKAFKVHIDHHLDFEEFAEFPYRDVKASSTSELVYRFIHELETNPILNQATAECLYTGILTDTGSFRYATTTPAVHRIVADLIEKGADVLKIHHYLFNDFTENRTRFVGYCLYERMRVLPELHTAYFTIPHKDLERFQIEHGDTEGLVNYTLSIQGINFGVIMIEYPEQIKMSFRSIGSFPANSFAAHFQGGGHFNAAGGKSTQSLQATEQVFLKLLEGYKNALTYEIN